LIKETEIVSFNLYPNPASNLLNFTLKDNPNSIKLEIFDISGKRLKFEQYFNHSIEEFKGSIDVSELKKGIYFCRFSNGKKEFVRKFIKQ